MSYFGANKRTYLARPRACSRRNAISLKAPIDVFPVRHSEKQAIGDNRFALRIPLQPLVHFQTNLAEKKPAGSSTTGHVNDGPLRARI
jgi:hypothetical protein